MNSFVFDIMKDLIIVWREGTYKICIVIVLLSIQMALGSIMLWLSRLVFDNYIQKRWESFGILFIVIGGLGAAIISLLQKSREDVKRDKKIEAVEKRVQENPKETKAAWELARVKLESYLDRNLSQVRLIFWMTLLVMGSGFALISVGVYESFQSAANLNPSILTTASGVIVSFIGGTFLVIYKATMSQAKDYVSILERINAVGMSVQILDTIDENETKLKHETMADVAKQLLSMYSGSIKNNKVPGKKKALTAG